MNPQLLKFAKDKIAIVKLREGRITTAEMEAQLKLPAPEVKKVLQELGYEEAFIKTGNYTRRIWRLPVTGRKSANGR